MKRLGLFQIFSISTGLLIAVWLLGAAVFDALWANQPLVKAFYDHDQLRDPVDTDGFFHNEAFDTLRAGSLAKARAALETAGFSCDPLDSAKKSTACTYGYQTDTGCCRFRMVIDYVTPERLTMVRGDKTGRCGK